MRMPINRLLYVLVGVALAAGLLVSAFKRPEPMLAASASCYGPCPSVTGLSLSRSTVAYGTEQAVTFRVLVGAGAPASGVPTGDVVVAAGGQDLCTIRLISGMGSCSPSSRALRRGLHQVVAVYIGGQGFMPSTSSPRTLQVI